MSTLVGQTVSHYKILEKLGGGGMGVVYKAEAKRGLIASICKVLYIGAKHADLGLWRGIS